MARRIEVCYKKGVADPVAESLKKKISRYLNIHLNSLKIIEAYNIDFGLFDIHLKKLGEELFADQITQEYSFKEPIAKEFSYLIEVGFNAGVTDTSGKSIRGAIKDILGIDTKVYTSKQYLLKGKISRKDAEKIAKNVLGNESFQKIIIFDKPQKIMAPIIPKTGESDEQVISTISLNVNDKELVSIIKNNDLCISIEDLKKIKALYKQLGKDPTNVELSLLADIWNEQTRNKAFNSKINYNDGKKNTVLENLSKTHLEEIKEKLSKDRHFLVPESEDNRCMIRFNKDYSFMLKVKTFEMQSEKVLYNEALSAMLGVNREVISKGASFKSIVNSANICMSPIVTKKNSKEEKTPVQIFENMSEGVIDGIDRLDTKIALTSAYFYEKYNKTPILFCGAAGLVPSKINASEQTTRDAEPDDQIILVGERIGKDEEVQIGDAITQKNIFGLINEAEELKLLKTATDNNKGLYYSIIRMCQKNIGAEIQIEKIQVKDPVFPFFEILRQKNQQNMLVVAKGDKTLEFCTLAKRRGIDAVAIGKFTDSGKFNASFKGKNTTDIDIRYFSYDYVKTTLNAKWKAIGHPEPKFSEPKDLTSILKKMLSRDNICSSLIKNSSIIKPIHNSDEGVIISQSMSPGYSDIDTYHMASAAVDKSVREHISKGGDFKVISALSNFCYSYHQNHDSERKLAEIVRVCQSLNESCLELGITLTSRNKSFEDAGKTNMQIPQTLLFSIIGKIDDVKKQVTSNMKKPEDAVYVIGKTNNELGASEYLRMHESIGNSVPVVDFRTSRKTYDSLISSIKKEFVNSCMPVSEGGMIVAMAKAAIESEFGMEIDLTSIDSDVIRNDFLLFSESQSRFLVTVDQKNRKKFEEAMRGCSISFVGKVLSSPRFIIKRNKKVIINSSVPDLKKAYSGEVSW